MSVGAMWGMERQGGRGEEWEHRVYGGDAEGICGHRGMGGGRPCMGGIGEKEGRGEQGPITPSHERKWVGKPPLIESLSHVRSEAGKPPLVESLSHVSSHAGKPPGIESLRHVSPDARRPPKFLYRLCPGVEV